jgi:hypothetical protein
MLFTVPRLLDEQLLEAGNVEVIFALNRCQDFRRELYRIE